MQWEHEAEDWRAKLRRKFTEEPLIPIGSLATALVLAGGLRAFKSGNARRSQWWMRARVTAQGFTVLAFAVGMYLNLSANTAKPKDV